VKLEAQVTDPLEVLLLPRAHGLLRVCVVLPQSGPLGLAGPSALDAALLAAHEANAEGGAGGLRVDLVLVDGGRRPTVVADEVRRLRDAEAIDVVTGFHTSDVHRAIESVTAGRTPYVFTPPHEGGPRAEGVVCIGTDPRLQLRGSMAWITARHKARSWALVGNDYIWPRSVHRIARRIVAGHAGRVVLERRVPLGGAPGSVDQLLDELRRSRADAVLLSLVGRDLATFNTALRHSGLDRRLVRLSPALEENGLMAAGGDRSGLLYASMSSFATLHDERRLDLLERHRAVLGPEAPVLDAYAEGVYEGVRLVTLLARQQALTPSRIAAGVASLRSVPRRDVHLALADGLDFAVVPPDETLPYGNRLP
jgi:ABC-type branched-subunit amino acid transport system substrate-binding protein